MPLDAGDGRRPAPRVPRRSAGAVAPLTPLLELFAPPRIAGLAREGDELLAPRSAAGSTSPIPPWCRPTCRRRSSPARGCTPLADALTAGPVTLAHGDLATVNMAFEGDRLILLDWAMPTAAPGALDVARFLVGCAHVVDMDPDEFIAPTGARPVRRTTRTRLSSHCYPRWAGWVGTRPWTSWRARIRRCASGSARASPGGQEGTDDSREWSIVMDLETLYRRTIESSTTGYSYGGPGRWGAVTPCLEWDVRALVITWSARTCGPSPWSAGRRSRRSGDRFDGGLLARTRARPLSTARSAASRGGCRGAAEEREGSSSYGDEDLEDTSSGWPRTT